MQELDKNEVAVSIFNKLAQQYQDKFMDVNLYGDSFNFFCNRLETKNASILELACGPGNITQYLLNKRPDFKVLGTDLAPNMVALAKTNNPSASFKVLDCREITALRQKFDGIVCGFCLPYLSKEECLALISNCAKTLNSKGILYLSTIEGDYSSSANKKGSSGDEIFMHYYQAEFLQDVLRKNGFEILEVQHKSYPANDGSTTTDVIIVAQK